MSPQATFPSLGMKRELKALTSPVKPPRERLPDTRPAKNHKFEIGDLKGYVNVGFNADGQPRELFIFCDKAGTTIGGLLDGIGVLTSIALQSGVALETLVKKFEYQQFEPSGFTKHPDIRHAKSITDYVFRWLGHEFVPGYREKAMGK